MLSPEIRGSMRAAREAEVARHAQQRRRPWLFQHAAVVPQNAVRATAQHAGYTRHAAGACTGVAPAWRRRQGKAGSEVVARKPRKSHEERGGGKNISQSADARLPCHAPALQHVPPHVRPTMPQVQCPEGSARPRAMPAQQRRRQRSAHGSSAFVAHAARRDAPVAAARRARPARRCFVFVAARRRAATCVVAVTRRHACYVSASRTKQSSMCSQSMPARSPPRNDR